jgi:acyl-CoA synthetase (AMP-forming)/AMP-acid ligase II
MGLIGQMLTSITTGMDLWILTPEQFIRNPKRWVECFGRDGATVATSPSFGYSYAARRLSPDDLAGLDFSRWRAAILGTECIDPAGVGDFTALVAPLGFDPCALIGAYGLAESTLAVTGCGRAADLRSCASRAPRSSLGPRWEPGQPTTCLPSHCSCGQRRGAAGLARPSPPAGGRRRASG